MDRYPPSEDSAFRYPPHGGGHGAKRRWQPREAGAGQEPGSFLSNARTREEWDALTLERAADVLIRRSKKPRSFWLGVLARVLRESAAKIREARP